MRSYTAPIVLAVLGLLMMAAITHGFGQRGRAKGTDQPFSARALLVTPLVLAAYALYGVLETVWSGDETWRAWLGALAVQLCVIYHGQRARERFLEANAFEHLAPPEEKRTRSRVTCLFFALAFGALLVVALVLPHGGAGATAWRVVASALLFVVSMVSLCAATWSSVWVFRTREPTANTNHRH
jgi:hypothetical protein